VSRAQNVPTTRSPRLWSTPRNTGTTSKAGTNAVGDVSRVGLKEEAHLIALHPAGEHTDAELGELFGVGRSTGLPCPRPQPGSRGN